MIDNKQYLWIDLFSEGIAGILSEQSDGWFYKSNLGDGRFTTATPVAPKPSFSLRAAGSFAIQELEGDGLKYLAQHDNHLKGFFKLAPDDQWQPFKSFASS